MKCTKYLLVSIFIASVLFACKSDDDNDDNITNDNSAFIGAWEIVSFKADDGKTYGINEWFPYIEVIQGCEVIYDNELTKKLDFNFLDNENAIVDTEYLERSRSYTIQDTVNCTIDYDDWGAENESSISLPYKYLVQGSNITISFLGISETNSFAFVNGNLIIGAGTINEATFKRK